MMVINFIIWQAWLSTVWVDVNAEARGVAAARRQRNKVMSVAAPF